MHLFDIKFKYDRWLIVIITTSIFGMLVSFLYQSYGIISISFSTLFIISSYIFLYKLYKRLPESLPASIVKKAIKWFYISTLGIWMIGPISALLGKSHWAYHSVIQFFLHFQINGWLFYIAIGILLYYASYKDRFSTKNLLSKKVINALDISLFLGLSPLAYWVYPNILFIILNGVGTALLCYSLFAIVSKLWYIKEIGLKNVLIKLICIYLIINGISHLIAISPNFISELAFNRNLIVAYLHLILLGIVSFTFIFHVLNLNLIQQDNQTYLAIGFLIIGFISTEFILMYQGLFKQALRYHFELLWGFTLMLICGVILLSFQIIYTKKSRSNERLSPK